MKCALMLLVLAAASASPAQDLKPSPHGSGYSYYVSSNWPAASHQVKTPSSPSRKETAAQVKEEPSIIVPRESQSNAHVESQSYSPRDEKSYGRNEDRYGYKDNYNGYRDDYNGYREDYFKVIGRHGLGFEKRIASADGLRKPITPESLEHVGKRQTLKELKYVPL